MFKNVAIVFVALALFFVQCDTKQEAIPAYLQLDSASIKTTIGQGTVVNDIRAVQVYVNNRAMGTFPLPCTVPIIASGKSEIIIQAMISENGSNSVFRPMLVLKTCDTILDLQPGKTTLLSAVPFAYRANAKMGWIEDFEDKSSTLVPLGYNSKADTQFIDLVPYELRNKWVSNTYAYHIKMADADTNKYFDMRSFTYFNNLPTDGRQIILEFDLKNNVPLQLYVQRKTSSGEDIIPYYYIGAENTVWKRYYINLAYEVAGQEATAEYKWLFSAHKVAEHSGEGEIFLDNIRLTYLE